MPPLPKLIEDASSELTSMRPRLLASLAEDRMALNERATGLDNNIAALSAQQTGYHH